MSKPLSASDPASLAAAAKCFCATPAQQEALKTYLLDNIALVATNPACTTPSAPTGVSASNARVADPTTQMNVRWLQPANSGSFITGYVIKWGTVSGVYTNSMNVPLTPKNFTVTGLNTGTTYFFVVQAFAFAGCVSANSNEATGTTNNASTGCAFATAWAARVVANGGAVPSMATQNAVCDFQSGLVADGLDTLMIAWNAFAADNLIAAISPQLVGPGSDPWANTNFVAGDLTATGLKGNALNKWLGTGLRPSNLIFPAFSFSFIVYMTTSANEAGGEFGTFTGADGYDLQNFTNTTFFDSPFSVRFSMANALWKGYQCATRTANNAAAIYQATSVLPHALLISSAAVAGDSRGLETGQFSTHAINALGAPNSFISRTLGFVGMATGMTQAQSLLLFNRIQTLMTAFGRQV